MDDVQGKIESILFLATKPMAVRQLARTLGVSEVEARTAVEAFASARNASASGVHVLLHDDTAQLVTNPAYAELVQSFTEQELDAELTRPSLETLTIIAYRGPVTKPEIEAIRGVNCSLILRNLLLRGLVTEKDDAIKMQPIYALSTDALRFFGIHRIEELPDYEELHANARIAQLLATLGLSTPAV